MKEVEQIYTQKEQLDLQNQLARYPKTGKIIKGSGGLRKVRWPAQGQGKSGGARIIYYPILRKSVIYLLYIYLKSDQSDLTSDQIDELRKIVKRHLK